jgi:hypothetical protein
MLEVALLFYRIFAVLPWACGDDEAKIPGVLISERGPGRQEPAYLLESSVCPAISEYLVTLLSLICRKIDA